jgi:hypothetical protein
MSAAMNAQADPGSRRRFLVAAIVANVSALVGRHSFAQEANVESAPDSVVWRSVLITLFPHPTLDARLYDGAAEALAAAAASDPATRSLLAGGFHALERAADGSWGAADAGRRTSALRQLEGTPFFQLLRQTSVFTFYADPRVWQSFGYEGDATVFGGYLARGLDTLEWLPEPRS